MNNQITDRDMATQTGPANEQTSAVILRFVILRKKTDSGVLRIWCVIVGPGVWWFFKIELIFFGDNELCIYFCMLRHAESGNIDG